MDIDKSPDHTYYDVTQWEARDANGTNIAYKIQVYGIDKRNAIACKDVKHSMQLQHRAVAARSSNLVLHSRGKTHTIGTITSDDTAPLGTYLDPYCWSNDWASNAQVRRGQHSPGRILLS